MRSKLSFCFAGLLMAIFACCLLISTQAKAADDDKVFVIRATQTFAATHPWQKGLDKFKELVEARTNGRIKVETYPAGQLSGGNNRTMCEQVQAGTLQLLIQSPPSWAGIAPKTSIFNLPFLWPNQKVALEISNNSPVMKEITDVAFDGLGVTFLGIWENGYRNVTSRVKVIHTPEDLKGLKIRIPPTPLLTDVFSALEALPVVMSMPEVYTALQQGAVDAQENPVSAIYSNKLFEVAPKITLWRYCWDPGMMTINKPFYDSLPDDLRQAVDETIKEAGDYVNELTTKEYNELIPAMKDTGAEIYELTDAETQVFVDKLAPVYAKYTELYGPELIAKLQAEIDSYSKK
jgi:tripartite ATP-independent transporter DctP family solute receptor